MALKVTCPQARKDLQGRRTVHMSIGPQNGDGVDQCLRIDFGVNEHRVQEGYWLGMAECRKLAAVLNKYLRDFDYTRREDK